MSGEGRYYHTPAHALALCDPRAPIQTLSALFHDLVYYQVDHGFAPGIWEIVRPYLKSEPADANLSLQDEPYASDQGYQMVCQVFGIKPGFKLYQSAGSNEFLSSLVMAKTLQAILPVNSLLQVACYIEATIPFRGVDETLGDPFDRLAQRLRDVIAWVNLQMGEAEIIQTIQGAVQFANQDVANFSSPDPLVFLESTWSLLPEFTPALRRGGEYTLGDYRHALMEMDRYLVSIGAEGVLHSFYGVPPEEELESKRIQIQRNLTLSHAYLELKLLSLAILEALASISGGDAPVSALLSDVQKLDAVGLKAYLPPVGDVDQASQPDDGLYHLLESGVKGPLDYIDMKTAPVAFYLYQRSKPGQLSAYRDSAYCFFAGKIKPLEFLQCLDACILAVITKAVSCLAEDRREKLIDIQRLLEKECGK
jgi:hypothetical protein